jgi:ABC-2 type transport system permease protein
VSALAPPGPDVAGPAPELRDVPGPSALGGGWRRARDLLVIMSVNDFKRTFHGTVLGYLWSVGRPLLLFAVLYEVFTKIVRFGHVAHYPALLLMNIVLFGLFQEATVTAVGSVVGQEAVVRKTQFPRLVIPLSVVATSIYNVLANLIVVIVFALATGVSAKLTWLLFPIILLALTGITTAASMIVAVLYPRFRDISIIWTVFTTALFYATPVIYPLSFASGHRTLHRLLELNPLTPIFQLAHKWIISPSEPLPALSALIAPAAIYLALCGLAIWLFRREAPRIAEAL